MFILDNEVKNVTNQKIKPLLEEVRSSYYQGNYRSAIVVNYTAIIMDLLDKLTDLSTIHHDDAARDILSQINQARENNATSPKWETKLVELIENRTELINIYELNDLAYIKEQRNYAAHPVTTVHDDEWKLKEITQETCIDVLRKSYEIVFLKQPILGKKILMDIIYFSKKSLSSIGIDQNHFAISLKDRYLSRMSQNAKDSVFKDLFKFTFRISDDKPGIVDGRPATLQALVTILEENKEHYLNILSNLKIDQLNIGIETVSTVPNFSSSKTVALLRLISLNPSIKNMLNETAINDLKVSIDYMHDQSTLTENSINFINLFEWRSSVILSNPNDFLENMLTPISGIHPSLHLLSLGTFQLIYNQFLFYGEEIKFLKFTIINLTGSTSYSEANNEMEKIPYLFDKLTIELFDLLFFRLDNNNQFYESFYFQSFLSELLKTYNTKFNIDLNQDNKRILFPNLFSDTKNLN
ncbi:hypothetical protein BCB11_14935, partial [Listeria monocytogenes]|nr:hypothetical protein [Listeria monocytogenes]